jgi:hypothetical protein
VVVGTTAGLGTADVETTTRGARYSFQVIRTGAGLTVAEIPRMKILVVDRHPLMRFGLLAFLRAEDDSLTICVAENIHLRAYLWTQVIRWERRKHRRTAWRQLRQRYSRWPAVDDVELFDPARVHTTWYVYRGARIPSPWPNAA